MSLTQVSHITGELPHVRHVLGESPQLCHVLGESPQLCHVLGELPQVCLVLGESPHLCHVLGESPQVCHVLGESPQVCRVLCESPQLCRVLDESPQLCHVLGELPQLCRVLGELPQVCRVLGESPQVCHVLGESPQVCHVLGESPQVCRVAGGFAVDELQLLGRAQLAVSPVAVPAVRITFRHMIGDRSGAVHVAAGQTLDLALPGVDLPFSVSVHRGGQLALAPSTILHGVHVDISGRLLHVRNVTVTRGGRLSLERQGHAGDDNPNRFRFDSVHVKNGGEVRLVSDPVADPGSQLAVERLHIDGGGAVRATHLYLRAVNVTVDVGGTLAADGAGYGHDDGAALEADGRTYRTGLHGVINPGRGAGSGTQGAGAGHGGSGGEALGEPLSDLVKLRSEDNEKLIVL